MQRKPGNSLTQQNGGERIKRPGILRVLSFFVCERKFRKCQNGKWAKLPESTVFSLNPEVIPSCWTFYTIPCFYPEHFRKFSEHFRKFQKISTNFEIPCKFWSRSDPGGENFTSKCEKKIGDIFNVDLFRILCTNFIFFLKNRRRPEILIFLKKTLRKTQKKFIDFHEFSNLCTGFRKNLSYKSPRFFLSELGTN